MTWASDNIHTLTQHRPHLARPHLAPQPTPFYQIHTDAHNFRGCGHTGGQDFHTGKREEEGGVIGKEGGEDVSPSSSQRAKCSVGISLQHT
jgi:hypothetical protein